MKHVLVLGVCVASIGSLALTGGGSPSTGAAVPQAESEPAAASIPVPVAPAKTLDEAVWRIPELGLACEPVPVELATHLGLEPGSGMMVADVQADSLAARSGLARYDVIVSVNDGTAALSVVEEALASSSGLRLRVVRAGVELSVPVATDHDAGRFLSTAALGPDHPFQRLDELARLRTSYSERADQYSSRMRELDERTRETHEEARRQVGALQEAAVEQIAEYLDARSEELLGLVDERLADERLDAVRELPFELSEVLPEERLDAVDASLAEAEALFRGLHQDLRFIGEDQNDVNRARQRVASLENEVVNLFVERIRRPWRSAGQEIEQHRGRLGKQQVERTKWTEDKLEAIRNKVRERILCAIGRTRDELAKKLRGRLQKMEVPRPGEIEASLEDACAQIEAMTWRFIHRTDTALDVYTEQLGVRNEAFVRAAPEYLGASEAATAAFGGAATALLEERLGKGLVTDGTWQARAKLDRLVDDLRGDLRRTLNQGRDGTRAGAVGLSQELREQKVVSEDAWRDLQQLLGAVLQAASNDCWKLDGPHLDGRFPRPQAPKGAPKEVSVLR